MLSSKRLDNRGSALIIVIVIMTVVGVLATILLSMTSINAQSKKIDTEAKRTFYDAESALDEVTLGVENVLAEATNSAYSSIFTEFTTLSNEERNNKFQDEIIDEVKASLKFNETVRDVNGKLPIEYLLQDYITNSSATIESVGSFATTASPKKSLIIKAVKIVYTDGDYSNTITTDIRINVPKADLSANIPKTSTLSFEKYGLICENKLLVDNKKLTVNGDIYAGYQGININDSNAAAVFTSDNIISKGDILVSNTYSAEATSSKVTLTTASTSRTTKTNIWAKNIVIKDDNELHSLETLVANKKNTDISFANASVRVRDDLELYSPGSRVIMSGDYFGFGNSPDNEPESSAIILNGRNSYLDIRGLSTLQLAGRSFIRRPTKYEDGKQEFDGMAMGESLTLRGNQIAYFVPSACLSTKHNPVTWDEYKNTTITFDITAIDVPDKFTLADYLTDTKYTASTYKKPNGNYVVYYYLDIKSNMLTKFYDDYCKTFGTSRMADIFTVDGLKTNTVSQDGNVTESGSISAVGTIVSDYISDGTINDMVVYDPGEGGVGISAVGYQEDFKYWTSYLRSEEDEAMSDKGYSTDKGVVENLINYDLIDTINRVNGDSPVVMNITDTDGSGYSVVIIDNYGGAPYVVPTGMKGMVIATGDVELNFNGGNFSGVIIAGCSEMKEENATSNGIISIESTSTVIANEKIVKSVLGNTNLFKVTYEIDGDEKTATLGDFFNEPNASSVVYVPEVNTGTQQQFQSLAGLVVYENWTKE